MKNYAVCVNGERIPVLECRSSAMPFNRVWPGHQRPLDQSEISYFASFDLVGKAEVSVTVSGEEIRSAEIRPLSLAIPFVRNGNTLTFTLDAPRNLTVEINGYAQALCLFANEPAEAIPDAENVIRFAPGEHHVGILCVKSNQTVVIEEGAVVYGGILIDHAQNVRITGHGVLDGSEIPRETAMYNHQKNNLFAALSCRNLSVDGIILRDAPCWAFTIRNGCENVSVRNVKLVGMWRYNSDGFDLCNCYHVELSHCFARCFDDCLVVRAPYLDGETGGCEDVFLHDNVLWCDWGKCMEIWSGYRDSRISGVRFERNECVRVCHVAMSIDTWFGSDDILVENVVYKDNIIDSDEVPLSPKLQNSDEERYEDCRSDQIAPRVTLVCANRLGKDLGNQQCDTSADISGVHVRYRNVSYENIRVLGPGRGDFLSVIGDEKLTECSGIRVVNSNLGTLTMLPE